MRLTLAAILPLCASALAGSMMGGWSSMSPSDPVLPPLISFACASLPPSPTSTPYSTTFDVSAPHVVSARRQVVAGVNYGIVFTLPKRDGRGCEAVIDAVVYDRFGDLSLTKAEVKEVCE
mmetsp:Transcript_21363/g.44555  ORF Transcript_21363/g.44555 Transcript_21363/m.44555 type:complete len:120 (+) Transcript_21363:21-380(+)